MKQGSEEIVTVVNLGMSSILVSFEVWISLRILRVLGVRPWASRRGSNRRSILAESGIHRVRKVLEVLGTGSAVAGGRYRSAVVR